jgi:polysaccharide export outer membrane protein
MSSKITICRIGSWIAALSWAVAGICAASGVEEYVFVPGDTFRIIVFKSPELSTEARVSGSGVISYPLLGSVKVVGLTPSEVEHLIGQQLVKGAFITNPQISVLPEQTYGNQVSVLGEVNRPGRYPIAGLVMRLSDMVATAGGISATGGDQIIVSGSRDGKKFLREIDIRGVFQRGKLEDDIELQGGDTLYVGRPRNFYIYGNVQHPGVFRLEPFMTLRQALAAGGGPTIIGNPQNPVVYRRSAAGKVEESTLGLSDVILDADVIYVKERMF